MDKKKIIVYGLGRDLQNYAEDIREKFQVIGVIDKSVKVLQEFNEVSFYTCDQLDNINYDYILISSRKYEGEIKEELLRYGVKETQIIGIAEIIGDSYSYITFEISDHCNAKCKYCVTGRKNRNGGSGITKKSPGAVTLKQFQHFYKILADKAVIKRGTEISLYNWGEPLLNPDFIDIISWLETQKQCYSFSTNASIVKRLPESLEVSHLKDVFFSMPGFSQASYDKIHKFCFQDICSHIIEMVEDYRKHGFHGDFWLAYHVYQFSRGELEPARKFAEMNGILFKPYYPYFNGYNMAMEYLTDTMDYQMLKEAGKDLELFYVDEWLENRPENYSCPQADNLVIGTDGKIKVCCVIDKNCEGNDILSLDAIESVGQVREVKQREMNRGICQNCRRYKIDYWANTPKPYEIK